MAKPRGPTQHALTPAEARARVTMLSMPCRWLIYSKPFFDDDPYVLEPGGYPSLKAWGARDPSICSMHPLKLVSVTPGAPCPC